MATNAIEAMGRLVQMDRRPLTHDEIVKVLEASYR